MKTTKPITTISFNTIPYLTLKLDELIKSRKVTFYAFIPHEPEDDEAGTKPHTHLYIEPAVSIQTEDIRDHLKEYDATKPGKPLGVLPFRSCKAWGDWYLYAKHDADYLASKGQSRRFHYTHEQFITSDEDNLNYLTRLIDLSQLTPMRKLREAYELGMTFDDCVYNGHVPIPQINSYATAWNILVSTEKTRRNGRKGHPDGIQVLGDEYLDTATGEAFKPDFTELNTDDDLPY